MILVVVIIIVLILLYYSTREGATGGYSYGGAYSGPAAVGASGGGGAGASGSIGGGAGGGARSHNMPYPSAGAYSGWYGYGLSSFDRYFPRSWVGLMADAYMYRPPIIYIDDDAGAPYLPRRHVPICEDTNWRKPCNPLDDPDTILV